MKKNLVICIIFVLVWCSIFWNIMKATSVANHASPISLLHHEVDKYYPDDQVKKLNDEIEEMLSRANQERKTLIDLNYTFQKVKDINQNIHSTMGPEPETEQDTISSRSNDLIKTEMNLPLIPVLTLAYNRPSVSRCINLLLKYRPSRQYFPIIVSQDGSHAKTAQVIDSYGDNITHIYHPDEGVASRLSNKHAHLKGYFLLAAHFKWAIRQAFDAHRAASAILIVEDDLEIASDFYSYFTATHRLLMTDPTLLCVSAWNDNGKPDLIDRSEAGARIVYRTDFFPGLGWMLSRKLWEEELEAKWPEAFWDDWLRSDEQRKGRACIRPEISRTSTFGKVGVSAGQFFDKHLRFIALNDVTVTWTSRDVDLLSPRDAYDRRFLAQVYDNSPLVRSAADISPQRHVSVRMEYATARAFVGIAQQLGLMTDFKAGVPRTAYLGVVTVMFRGVRVFVARDRHVIAGYDPQWRR